MSCGYTSNVLVEINDLNVCCGGSNPSFFMRLTFGRHNLRLNTMLEVTETGKSARNISRTTYGVWDVNPSKIFEVIDFPFFFFTQFGCRLRIFYIPNRSSYLVL